METSARVVIGGAVDSVQTSCLYDLRLVRTPEVPRGVAVEGNPHQLGDCLL